MTETHEIKLNTSETVTKKTGLYDVERTVNGVKKDTIRLFIWSEEDIAAAEKDAEEKELEMANTNITKKTHKDLIPG